MSRADLAASWQRKLDELFPQGAIATWMRGPGERTSYQVQWMMATGTQGLDPLVMIYVWGGKVLGPYRLTSWDVLRTKPHLMVQAQFEGQDPMLLCAAVPAALAAQMGSTRQSVIDGNMEAARLKAEAVPAT